MDSLDQDLSRGTALYNSGQFVEARAVFEDVEKLRPDDSKVLSLLAGSLAALGEADAAQEKIQKALKTDSNVAMVQVMAGHVYSRLNQIEEAEQYFRYAIALMPDQPGTLYSLGHNLLAQARYKEALGYLEKAAAFDNTILDLKQKIAAIHWQLKDYDKASGILEEILRETPNDILALNELGLVRKSQGRIHDAIELFQKAVEVEPSFELANKNLGTSLQENGNADAAAAQFDEYEAKNQALEVTLLNALVLPVVSDSVDEIDKWRNRLVEGMNRAAHSGQVLHDPLHQIGRDHFHLAYHARNDKDIQRHIAHTYLKVAPTLGAQFSMPEGRGEEGLIKVGFVSTKLCNHTVGYLNVGYIEHLDRSKFQVDIICPDDGGDSIRKKIESAADNVHFVPRYLDKARSIIAELKYDILYFPDIGMEPFSYFLAFARMAPVQAVAWGHPVTTGIPNVDYFVSCDLMEPENGQDSYSETLIRLPDAGGYYYRPIKPEGQFDRGRNGLPEDQPIIACLQSCFKFHPDFDPIVKNILTKVPDAILVLIDFVSEHLAKRLKRTLGDDFNRVHFVQPLLRDDFLLLASEANVLLDIPQWAGGRTSYECLAMGTPIVHLPGKFMRGRDTLAFYETIGVLDCVAENEHQYVDIAERLVKDQAFNAAVRGKISSNVSKLFKRQSAVTALEDFFIDAIEVARS